MAPSKLHTVEELIILRNRERAMHDSAFETLAYLLEASGRQDLADMARQMAETYGLRPPRPIAPAEVVRGAELYAAARVVTPPAPDPRTVPLKPWTCTITAVEDWLLEELGRRGFASDYELRAASPYRCDRAVWLEAGRSLIERGLVDRRGSRLYIRSSAAPAAGF